MFQLVFPLVGVGILIAVPETIQANPWSWAVVAGLIFSLPAGIADKAYRSLKGGDDDK